MPMAAPVERLVSCISDELDDEEGKLVISSW
jgi:hypothetical protein